MGGGGERYIVLHAGDIVVFDGTVIHAGADYKKTNTRLHIYLDVVDIVRTKTVYTWLRRLKCERYVGDFTDA